MTRPIDVARRACPSARSSYLAAFEQGDGLFIRAGITQPLRLAHFCAQSFHETGGLTIEWESGAYSAERLLQIFGVGHHSAAITPDEAQRLARNGPAIFERVYGLGNPRKAAELGNSQPGDGYRYRGGGIMQTTGRANYRRMGQKCGVDFESHPELVVSAEHALKPALAEWTEGNLNVAADRDDILTITRRINGGVNGLDDRKAWLRRLRPMIDVVSLDPRQPASPLPAATVTADSDKIARARGLQKELAAAGFYLGDIDGDFGPKSIKAFQRSRGLMVDGVIGPKTRPLLDAALALVTPLTS
jgi:putative chitinase